MSSRVYDDGLDTETTKTQAPSTIYSQFRAELNKPITVEKEVTLKVPARETIKIRYSTDIDLDQITRWRVKAKKSKRTEEIDLVLFNQMVITSQCRAIIFDGTEVVDESDRLITFNTDGFQESLNAIGPYGAVKELFVRDADILRVGDEILEAAGYGSTDLDEDTDPLD